MGDAALAEDVAQEAFLRAWRLLPRYRTGSFVAWLLTIVRNEALDQRRSRQRWPVPVEQVSAAAAPGADLAFQLAAPGADRDPVAGLHERAVPLPAPGGHWLVVLTDPSGGPNPGEPSVETVTVNLSAGHRGVDELPFSLAPLLPDSGTEVERDGSTFSVRLNGPADGSAAWIVVDGGAPAEATISGGGGAATATLTLAAPLPVGIHVWRRRSCAPMVRPWPPRPGSG